MWQSGFTFPVFMCPLPGSLGKTFLCFHLWMTRGSNCRTNFCTSAIYPGIFYLCLRNHQNETLGQDCVDELIPWEPEASLCSGSFCRRIIQMADPMSCRSLCCQAVPHWKEGRWWQSWINSAGNLELLCVKRGECLTRHMVLPYRFPAHVF